MRLLAITFGCILLTILSLSSIHYWGLSQNYTEFNHQFLKHKSPWIVVPWEQNFFRNQVSNIILLANVYKNDQDLFLVRPSYEKKQKPQDNIQQANASRPLLSDFIKTYPESRLILNLENNTENVDRQISEILKDEKSSERILIQSDFNVVLESIKKLQPLFLFGSTLADTTRLKSYDSLKVVSAAPFKGDIYFTALKVKGRSGINNSIANELHRRKIKIILGPLESTEEVQLALSLGADGLYVEKPEWLIKYLIDRGQ